MCPGQAEYPKGAAFATKVLEALGDSRRISGLTHNYYRYPARFPPRFAREAILAFSERNDVVLDPFMGGGTTAVESLNLGRRFLGSDINPLAAFVSRVKTTALTEEDVLSLLDWVNQLQRSPRAGRTPAQGGLAANVPYQFRKRIEALLDSIAGLKNGRQRNFARCSILKTAQWALDNRRQLPRMRAFDTMHRHNVIQMLEASFRGHTSPSKTGGHATSHSKILCRRAAGIESDHRLPRDWLPVKLVLTSPPYPGVHVLYHRWQVEGRRETPGPYWIVGREDGHASSHYTMGPRYAPDLSPYLNSIQSSFRSIAALMDDRSLIVQLLGFSNPENQLKPVLRALEAAGLEEISTQFGPGDGARFWRTVPNRKWHASLTGGQSGSEVLLVHRLAS